MSSARPVPSGWMAWSAGVGVLMAVREGQIGDQGRGVERDRQARVAGSPTGKGVGKSYEFATSTGGEERGGGGQMIYNEKEKGKHRVYI